MTTRLPAAIYQYRLWEESGFDPIVIEKIKRRTEEREAERIRRKLCKRVSRSILKFRKKEQRDWEAEQTERIQAKERRRAQREAILADPSYSYEDRQTARIELAGELYRDLQQIIQKGASA